MKRLLIVILLYFLISYSFAQNRIGFYLDDEINNTFSVPFKTINNLIILKLSINDSKELSFILDSGSKNTLLFIDDPINNPLEKSYQRAFEINGWGNGVSNFGFISIQNKVKLGKVIGSNISIVGINKSDMDISPFFGEKIDGILGIDIFKSLIVQINFQKQKIIFSNPANFVAPKKSEKIKIVFDNDKPFINCEMAFDDQKKFPIKLLIDLGESKPISLVVGTDSFIQYPNNFVYANLGVGLNGLISGFIGQNRRFQIGKFQLDNIFTAYPDENSLKGILIKDTRNGSIGMGVLNRFLLTFNLAENALYLKKNINYKKPFVFNRTGIEIRAEEPKYERFFIGNVVPYTPAYIYGLQAEDEILVIDGIPIEKLNYKEILGILEDKDKNFLYLKIKRGNDIKEFNLHLFSLFN